ncbi:hypothetical protein GCM10011390_36680 [Aureimonas endophytica]|uniref:Uncharacterized protein n=1 Tax=Aureimonas endophytica TaxID=2027858 RepID=A0A916ZU37_9HYPH|nr:hypothetical protein [Aureimonas endophytica]GGE14156.1 hypothetical protein GCM10011390_36680 [Aureimonas endophytica]
MLNDIAAGAPAPLEGFEAVELELALDLQEPSHGNFENCVRSAAEMVGGEMLFDMPADGSLEDASRIAAFRVPGPANDPRIVFAILDEAEEQIRIAGREEIGERFYGFAQSFVGVLERIRDSLAGTGEAGRPQTLSS